MSKNRDTLAQILIALLPDEANKRLEALEYAEQDAEQKLRASEDAIAHFKASKASQEKAAAQSKAAIEELVRTRRKDEARNEAVLAQATELRKQAAVEKEDAKVIRATAENVKQEAGKVFSKALEKTAAAEELAAEAQATKTKYDELLEKIKYMAGV